jgi:hypothetical protein
MHQSKKRSPFEARYRKKKVLEALWGRGMRMGIHQPFGLEEIIEGRL